MNSVNYIHVDYELQTCFHNNFHPNLFIVILIKLQVFYIKTFLFYSSMQNTLIRLQHVYSKANTK